MSTTPPTSDPSGDPSGAPANPPSPDLTAVLIELRAEADADYIARAVAGGGYGDVWLRMKPLQPLGLVQVELFDGNGMLRVDPALVMALSQDGRRATFVHLNRGAKQALVHAFQAGAELEGWMGAPEEIDARI